MSGRHFYAAFRKTRVPTHDEERELFRRMHAGDGAARDELIVRNRPLVVRTVQRYREKGLSLEDLIEEGMVGLIEAVDQFDPAMGTKLATYAPCWIRKAVLCALAEEETIGVPRYLYYKALAYDRVAERLEREDGEPATADRVAAEFGFHRRAQKRNLAAARRALAMRREMTGAPADRGRKWGIDYAPDPRSLEPDERLSPEDLAALRKQIETLLEMLSVRDGEILKLRFGFTPAGVVPLTEVAGLFGLSREGVRQAEIRAFRMFRKYLQRQPVRKAE